MPVTRKDKTVTDMLDEIEDEDKHECVACGFESPREDDFWSDSDSGDELCEDCANVCERCHDIHRAPTHEVYNPSRGGWGDWCSSCASDNATECWNCDRLTTNLAIQDVDDNDWCQNCCDNSAGFCEGCEVYYHRDDHDHEDYDEEDGYEESTRGIHNYSYKPDPEFHGDGPLYMGVELELECGPNASKSHAAQAVADNFVEFYNKEDCSISHGFEMVSHPMSLDYMKETQIWESVTGVLKEQGMQSKHHRTTGLHIHVNRTAFANNAHHFRLLTLVYANNGPAQRIAGRGHVGYSQWHGELLNIAEYEKNNFSGYAQQEKQDRQVAVNYHNQATVEFRMFKGTINLFELHTRFEFVDALVNYTRDNESTEWADFARWVTGRNTRYPALAKTIGGMPVIPSRREEMETEFRLVPRAHTAHLIGCDCTPCADAGTFETVAENYIKVTEVDGTVTRNRWYS